MSFIRVVFAGALLSASLAGAQTYPAKTVRIIVPFAPGQATDILARTMGDHLGKSLGQTFVIENRGGAGGTIGVGLAAKAAPDGYTLVMATIGPMAIAPSLYQSLTYDSVKDFAPISNMALTPQILVASPTSGLNSVKDLVALAKAKPGQISYATAGAGSSQHLAMVMLESAAGLKMVHVPYKGGSESQTALLGGQVNVMFDSIPAVLPHAKSGRMRTLGAAAKSRSPFLPDLPTIAEQGYPSVDHVGWIGIAAPAGTPEPIIEKLNSEIRRILNQPDVKEQFAKLAFVPVGDTHTHFTQFVKDEVAKYAKVVKDSGAKVD